MLQNFKWICCKSVKDSVSLISGCRCRSYGLLWTINIPVFALSSMFKDHLGRILFSIASGLAFYFSSTHSAGSSRTCSYLIMEITIAGRMPECLFNSNSAFLSFQLVCGR